MHDSYINHSEISVCEQSFINFSRLCSKTSDCVQCCQFPELHRVIWKKTNRMSEIPEVV